MKKEWKYLLVFGIVSILVIALLTNFKFKDVEVRVQEVYFVVNPIRAVIVLTFTLWTIKNVYLLIEIVTDKYKIIALFVN